MEKKKSLKANLEKTKTMFLSIGLIISITLVASAFNWQSDAIGKIITKGGEIIPEEINVIVTKPKPDPPKPPEKSKIMQVKKYILDVINITADTANIDDFELIIENFPPDDELIINDDEPMIITNGGGAIFPGGIKALQRFVGNHVNYPAVARENNIQGTVYLRFEVTKKGTIGRIEVLNPNIDNLLQDASTDVIKILPKFKPGMHEGKKVNVWFSIPISLKLNTN